MFRIAILLTSFLIVVKISTALNKSNCDKKSCSVVPKHYQELDCTPIITEEDCCPYVECPNLKELDDDFCYYHDQSFARGEKLPNNKMKGLCSAECMCDNYLTPARFTCLTVECPYDNEPVQSSECIQQRSFEKCCPINSICEQKEIDKLAICYFENNVYREGEMMYSDREPCYKCLCSKRFNNSMIIGNPECELINCGIMLRDLVTIKAGCVPIYYGTNQCCPIKWRCPQANDRVIKSESLPKLGSASSKNICHFGNLKLHLGEAVSSENACIECKCSTPPMVHCIQTPNC